MSKEQKSFRDTNLYPVLFMLVISVFFIGILATVYRNSEQKIANNDKEAYQRQLLSLFVDKIKASDPNVTLDLNKDLQKNYDLYVKPIPLNYPGRLGYSVTVKDSLIGYCFEIMGNGLWGSMRALLAVTPDLNTIININVYKQMETPGLGARVEEPWFRDQFQGKNLFNGADALTFSLIPEDQTATTATQIRQITGASITSNAVLRMIREEMQQVKKSQQGQVK